VSHIDSFKHSLVGSFLGIPVYLPLEDIDGDFRCTTQQLLIGGGSGEHLALVVQKPLAAVAMFLAEEVPHLPLSPETGEAWKAVYQPFIESDFWAILRFYEWDIKTYHSFFECCKNGHAINRYSVYSSSKKLEEWLILGFGEFIFFSMPQLAAEIVSRLSDPYQHFHHMRYNNILLIPPNMPVYANGGNAFFPKIQ
jgi:hypothetical protein